MLLSVPNISEGRNLATVRAVGEAFIEGGGGKVDLLDTHTDHDHHRSVYTLSGTPGRLAQALLAGAAEAVGRIDIHKHDGEHPRIGALDVAPVVYLQDSDRGAACAEALLAADLIASELQLPVFLYGMLGGGRTRAQLRRGGPVALANRIADRELVPDFGPARLHRTAGAVMIAARQPLIAFNLLLGSEVTLEQASAVATVLREGGSEGLAGVRVIAIELTSKGAVQISTNIENYLFAGPTELTEAVRRHLPVVSAELVGLAPIQAFKSFPEDLEIVGFDPQRHLIENVVSL